MIGLLHIKWGFFCRYCDADLSEEHNIFFGMNLYAVRRICRHCAPLTDFEQKVSAAENDATEAYFGTQTIDPDLIGVVQPRPKPTETKYKFLVDKYEYLLALLEKKTLLEREVA